MSSSKKPLTPHELENSNREFAKSMAQRDYLDLSFLQQTVNEIEDRVGKCYLNNTAAKLTHVITSVVGGKNDGFDLLDTFTKADVELGSCLEEVFEDVKTKINK